MSNDLAAEITRRVRKLLDGLLATLVLRRLSALPPLGQRLFTRYSDWVDGLFSRLHLPLTSALLFGRSSNLLLSPLSYAWFDRRWIDRRKRSRASRGQSGGKEDEDIQLLPIPEYRFEEDAGEGVIKQFQSARPEPADDIILSVPALMTSLAGNTEPTRAEQMAKSIALRLELLTNKGSLAPRQTPFEASGVPCYPGLVTNCNLLDKGNEMITSQPLSHQEGTDYPSDVVNLPPPSVHPVSGQYIGTVLMPVPGMFSLAEMTLTQTVSPFVPSSERMNFDLGPSGALPAALSGQPPSEVRIASPSYLRESPPLASNIIPAGKALAASFSYLFGPPQVASGSVLAGKADTNPASRSKKPPLFGRDETLDMTGAVGQDFERLAPRPALDDTWRSRPTSPWHRSAGHGPPSLLEEPIGQEIGEPARAMASTIKNSPFGGYSRSMEVGLALAPIGRQQGNIPAATSSAVSAGREAVLETAGETMEAIDPEVLASEVYGIIKRRLLVERERTTSVVS